AYRHRQEHENPDRNRARDCGRQITAGQGREGPAKTRRGGNVTGRRRRPSDRGRLWKKQRVRRATDQIASRSDPLAYKPPKFPRGVTFVPHWRLFAAGTSACRFLEAGPLVSILFRSLSARSRGGSLRCLASLS